MECKKLKKSLRTVSAAFENGNQCTNCARTPVKGFSMNGLLGFNDSKIKGNHRSDIGSKAKFTSDFVELISRFFFFCHIGAFDFRIKSLEERCSCASAWEGCLSPGHTCWVTCSEVSGGFPAANVCSSNKGDEGWRPKSADIGCSANTDS